MTVNNRWLLPEGIEELLPPEAERIERLHRRVVDLFHSWGYELVMPPMIDYLESLLTGTGNDLDVQTFKLIDQLTGRMMGIRADMAPQVARIDAHHLQREGPMRLCYLGTVLHTRPDGFAGSRSPLQVGAELYGYAGIESDVEVLELMLEVLALAGIDGVHVDLGHVGIYRGLVRESGLEPAQEMRLFDALQRKALPDIEALASELKVGEGTRRMLTGLVDLNGDAGVLEEAGKLLVGASSEVRQALDELERTAEALRANRPSLPIYYDLAELRGYQYHTGIVFSAYLPGHGQSIAWGGRYDDIGRVFGRARPATGFSTDLKTLMLLAAGAAEPQRGVFAPHGADPELRQVVAELRRQGERVVCELPGQIGGAREMGCDRVLEKRAGRWEVMPAGSRPG